MDAQSRRAAQDLLRENISLDFVNPVVAAGERDYFFASYERLLDWGIAAGTLHEREAAALLTAAKKTETATGEAIRYAKSIRAALEGALRAVATGRSAEAHLPALNDAMTAAAGHRRLAERLTNIVWDWPFDGDFRKPLWPVIPAAIDLLMSGGMAHLRECPGCGWLFLDSSRNHSRKWCRMSDCGNVAKVRSHRRRGRSKVK